MSGTPPTPRQSLTLSSAGVKESQPVPTQPSRHQGLAGALLWAGARRTVRAEGA